MKILVIRFLAIGDVVLTSVLCNSLKKSFPDAEVDYMVHEPSASLFLNHPYIDNVISLSMSERKNLFKYFHKVYQVTRKNYDIIIDATSTEKSGVICAFSRHAKFKIGRYKPKKGYFFNHKIKYNEPAEDKIKQRLQMLRPLVEAGYKVKYDHDMIIQLTDVEKQRMREIMISKGVDFNFPVLVFAASSKISFKKWRQEYVVKLINHCINKLNAQVVFFYWGKEEERDILNLHQHELNNHPRVFSNIRLEQSRDLAAIIKNCHMFVGNEGGPRHIAQALQIPTVAICSPSAHKNIWLPDNGDRYIGIEWKDIPENSSFQSAKFKSGDELYNRLYDSIKPEHVIPLVNQVFNHHVKSAISCVS